MMTFFYRHMEDLIKNGHLYIATPPLYLVKKGRSKSIAGLKKNDGLLWMILAKERTAVCMFSGIKVWEK